MKSLSALHSSSVNKLSRIFLYLWVCKCFKKLKKFVKTNGDLHNVNVNKVSRIFFPIFMICIIGQVFVVHHCATIWTKLFRLFQTVCCIAQWIFGLHYLPGKQELWAPITTRWLGYGHCKCCSKAIWKIARVLTKVFVHVSAIRFPK